MVLHPDIHLEIARQRHGEFVAVAEQQRIANALRRVGAIPKAWRFGHRHSDRVVVDLPPGPGLQCHY